MSDTSSLEYARVSRAQHAIAVCDDDGANVEIAVRIHDLLLQAPTRHTAPSENSSNCFCIRDRCFKVTQEFIFVFFIGDDQTDEEGFMVAQDLGGLAVYVGLAQERTVALHYLESPEEVHQVLGLLQEL